MRVSGETMTEPILVVDVGTSAARAALVVGGEATPVKEPGSGLAAWPASVCVADEGYLVGTAAEMRKRVIPGRYIDGPRRAIDAQASILLNDREVPGTEALAAYLAVLEIQASQLYGSEIPRLLLTVPAAYTPGDPRRDIMIDIGEQVGFEDVELVSDAVATALDPHATEHLPAGALVLVCDLGATWTTSLVQLYGSRTTQLAQESCTAGLDLDAQLLSDLRTQGRDWLEPLLAAPGDAGLRAYHEAIDFVRRLKHQLGDAEGVAEVSDHFTPVTPPYRLHRRWLEAFAQPAVEWLEASCQRVLATAGIRPDRLAAVVLAGGHSRLPATATAIYRALGQRDDVPAHLLRRPANPDLAALRGATRFALDAAARAIPAEPARWRVRPVVWDIPGGGGHLVRWTVSEGQPYRAGTVLAQVRTADERVFELTAAHDGVFLAQHVSPGQPVGPSLVAAVAKDAPSLLRHPPAHRHRFESGTWLLTSDGKHLVECDHKARVVRLRTITDGAVVSEFRPDHGDNEMRGRLFINPDGHVCLISWDVDGLFSVWDIETGKPTTRFHDAPNPLRVLVHEAHWRLAVESRSRGVGRFGRSVTTFWDLRTGSQITKVSDEQWQLHEPGYSATSTRDRLNRSALSPDGQLRATLTEADTTPSLVLTEASTDRELFRARGAAGHRARVGFSADGRHLLAAWETDERSLLDVWDI